MREFMICAVLGGGLTALISFLIWHTRKVARQRRDALSGVAQELGFEFFPNGQAEWQNSLPSFHLFHQGSGKRLFNLMRGRTQNLEVSIFDYHYTTGSGEDSYTWRQTVVCIKASDLDLPAVSLRPKTIWAKIGTWFGYQAIKFAGHPRFNDSFLLRGPDEEAIHKVFFPKVLDYLEDCSNICIEADGPVLLCYRPNDLVQPCDIRDRMDEGFEVLSLFRAPV